MNIGMISCSIMAVFFAITALIFTFLKEKGAMLISGFNTLSKEERVKYDQKKMSTSQRNALLIWTVILAIGAAASYFLSTYAAIPAFIIWLILFFKDVHFDSKKAFEKFLK